MELSFCWPFWYKFFGVGLGVNIFSSFWKTTIRSAVEEQREKFFPEFDAGNMGETGILVLGKGSRWGSKEFL